MSLLDSNAQDVESSVEVITVEDVAHEVEAWWDKIELQDILFYECGENPTREGLVDTPRRFNDAWRELLRGYSLKKDEILGTTWDDAGGGIVLCRKVAFTSVCEHHMLPFFGHLHVGYIANGRVVGFSKIARLIECISCRLQIQERMVNQIVGIIFRTLEPKSVVAICCAQHLCCKGRGVKQDEMEFTTLAQLGDVETREHQELVTLVRDGVNSK